MLACFIRLINGTSRLLESIIVDLFYSRKSFLRTLWVFTLLKMNIQKTKGRVMKFKPHTHCSIPYIQLTVSDVRYFKLALLPANQHNV
jgi:hypothetical protein